MSSSTHTGLGSDKSRSKQQTVRVVVTNAEADHDHSETNNNHNNSKKDDDDDDDNDYENDSVGSLLADIANAINNTLRILIFADKTHWGSDEFDQVRAVEDALDEAKRDFQELGPLVKGSFYYENDRRRMSPLF